MIGTAAAGIGGLLFAPFSRGATLALTATAFGLGASAVND